MSIEQLFTPEARARQNEAMRLQSIKRGWTDERIEKLKELKARGLSCSAIAVELGEGVTKNSVIGKSRRLGLTDRTWGDERIEKLTELWARGLPCGQIAIEIGVSRNAVIGKANRLGLPERSQNSPKIAKSPKEKMPSRPRSPRSLSPEESYRPKTVVEIAAPEMRPCSVMELKVDRCRFPIGEPGTDPVFFCGGTPKWGFVYCPYHCQIAYRPR